MMNRALHIVLTQCSKAPRLCSSHFCNILSAPFQDQKTANHPGHCVYSTAPSKPQAEGNGDVDSECQTDAPVVSHAKDYQYFKAIAEFEKLGKDEPKPFKLESALKKIQDSQKDGENVDDESMLTLYEGIDTDNLKPAVQNKSYNLAAYVAKSETLSKLVKMGVDLSAVEKHRSEANHLLKLDFKKDIEPLLQYFHDRGVHDKEISGIFSKNPAVFKADLEDIHTKVSYLESKKFTNTDIARIVSKAPLMLTNTVQELDTQLGYLQREFHLTGDEIRVSVSRCPKLATWSRIGIKQVKFSLEEYMGFTVSELKQLLLALPKIYIADERSLLQRFDYIHNEMGLTHDQIIHWPSVLRTRMNILKQRHQFLRHLGRDQFDPTKENYVSMKALVSGKDVEFCGNVAKSTVKHFNEFLKTL